MKGRIKPKSKGKGKKKGKNGKGSGKGNPGNNRSKSISTSPTSYAVDSKTLASLTPEERRAIAELEAEDRVKNGFERIFPTTDGFMYRQFFDEIRPLNELMSQYMMSRAARQREQEALKKMEQRANVSNSRASREMDRSGFVETEDNGRKGAGSSNGGGLFRGKKRSSSNALTAAALSHANMGRSHSLAGLEEPVLSKARKNARAQRRELKKGIHRKNSAEKGDAFRYIF